jgi:hypothetical protein
VAALSFKNLFGFTQGDISLNASLTEEREIYDRESYHRLKVFSSFIKKIKYYF